MCQLLLIGSGVTSHPVLKNLGWVFPDCSKCCLKACQCLGAVAFAVMPSNDSGGAGESLLERFLKAVSGPCSPFAIVLSTLSFTLRDDRLRMLERLNSSRVGSHNYSCDRSKQLHTTDNYICKDSARFYRRGQAGICCACWIVATVKKASV